MASSEAQHRRTDTLRNAGMDSHSACVNKDLTLLFWFLQAAAFENSNVRLVYSNARGTQAGKPHYAIVRQPSCS